MIAWSISAAIKAKCFDRIIVSTDDVEISSFAQSIGADVPFIRPSSLSEDYTPTGAVVKHALEWLDLQEILETKVCCLYATAPFVTPGDICQKSIFIESFSLRFCITHYKLCFSCSTRFDY